MTFDYKCRRCGEVDKSLHIGGIDDDSSMVAIHHLCNAIHGQPSKTQAPRLLSLHSCKDKGTGIADLIGHQENDHQHPYRHHHCFMSPEQLQNLKKFIVLVSIAQILIASLIVIL